MLEKHCIFCGQRPISKNKEHVVPEWAIRLTGDPKRECHINTLSPDPGRQVMKFAFDQLQFPACTECNDAFSDLESRTRPTVDALLARQPVRATDLSCFLDWVDKLRIGLWLGLRYLDKNYIPVTPNFYIAERMGLSDRAACLMLTDAPTRRITFSGVNTLAFRYMPSAFSFCINQLTVVSVSTDFLIARRMGLPYPRTVHWHESGKMAYTLGPGTNRIMRPPLRSAPPGVGTWLYQPMVRRQFIEAFDYWDTKYAEDSFLCVELGFGKVFVDSGGAVVQYPTVPSDAWIPRPRFESSIHAIGSGNRIALAMQDTLARDHAVTAAFSKEMKMKTRLILSNLGQHQALARLYSVLP